MPSLPTSVPRCTQGFPLSPFILLLAITVLFNAISQVWASPDLASCRNYVENWSYTYGPTATFPVALHADSTGEIFLLTKHSTPYLYQYRISKLSDNGDSLWQFPLPDSITSAHQTVVDRDGNLCIAYSVTVSPLEKYIVVRKYRPNGVVMWNRQIFALGDDVRTLKAIATSPDGDVAVAGLLRYHDVGATHLQIGIY